MSLLIVATMSQLWVGMTELWDREEDLINDVRRLTGITPKSCWFVRDRSTGGTMNYGFLTFGSVTEASEVMKLLKGSSIPNKPSYFFNLNWGTQKNEAGDIDAQSRADGFSIYVGNLPSDVNDQKLLEFIRSYVPGAINARLIYQQGISRGFGFVKFGTHQEVIDCIKKVSGSTYFGRPLKVNEASQNRAHSSDLNVDSSNTTLFISDIDPLVVKEDTLLHHFKSFGNVLKVRIDPDHPSWATIKMETHVAAESAKTALQGSRFGGTTACIIKWGRSVEDAITDKAPHVTVPVLKPLKNTRKLHPEFYNEAGIHRVIDVIQRSAENNRQMPLNNTNTQFMNREFNMDYMKYSVSLFEWREFSSSIPHSKRFWYY